MANSTQRQCARRRAQDVGPGEVYSESKERERAGHHATTDMNIMDIIAIGSADPVRAVPTGE